MSSTVRDTEETKAEWTKPELIELNTGLSDVESGFGPGTDGASSGATSS